MLKEKGASIAHWVTNKCPKPWDMVTTGPSPPVLKALCDPAMYAQWKLLWFQDQFAEAKQLLMAGAEVVPVGLV